MTEKKCNCYLCSRWTRIKWGILCWVHDHILRDTEEWDYKMELENFKLGIEGLEVDAEKLTVDNGE